ncbi:MULTISPECIES: rhodanese-related sulfurtransferase [unclassified Paracoccus (in: a-proteobacteria)]|uniref:oxygen-dependent tRNA uridine(34) hydroxylase TrhO n=1 Tax=unclassified Paracoccus (in: a-proteobacteria) TaxID=2688777 RepID=UPI0015FEBBB5|nr:MULTISPECIES: rhodanese-related sulfurtransferase [unclassified Paracoccus (in: a-proteobacteria)]MBB1491472.1 rhodanese-related sulfurtransferase [Paracoccus sp. MC1854]MBB1497644.1 rhodanese-related sulfurtransferase [Paracoccus sp. MC1862]QQO44085.1 rhodanese-related sulfurtransferase [Paracoccus sp. MC1862]
MFVVAALYHFAPLPDPSARREGLMALCQARGLRGTLILAREGINGTIAGPRPGIDAVLAHVRAWPGFEAMAWKESAAGALPFGRMKVRVKPEIVTMGQPQVDPTARAGRHVGASDWNAVISDPDTVVIDTRNDYEVAIGSFRGAVDPGTRSFREFPGWWAENARRFAGKRVAMFCTGGIRCEKSTSFLVSQGVSEVVHLQGGILKYLEDVPEGESLWNGACFVFDGRVSLTHGLEPGGHVLCHACRRPLAPEDAARPEYEEGVRCHLCADEYSEADRERFRERQRQVARGELFAG